MSETHTHRESTPEITIRYGVLQTRDGFFPILKIEQRPVRTVGSPRDRDAALATARHLAEEEADKYRGEWNIRVESLVP